MSEESTETTEATTTDADAVAGMVTPETPAAEAQYHYADGLPGEGVAPEWFKGDKYKTVSDQAKAYTDLESRFGSFTGAPEEYEIVTSDELKEKGVELSGDDPIMEEALKFAKESNMSQDGFNSMMELYGMAKVAEAEAIGLARADEIKALGMNAQSRLDNLNAWGKTNLPTDLFEGFQEMATSAAAVQALEKLVAMTRPAAMSATELTPAPGGMTKEELDTMQFAVDDNGVRKMQDPEYRAKFEKAANAFYGTEDYVEIVG
jgi:hypothetical protein